MKKFYLVILLAFSASLSYSQTTGLEPWQEVGLEVVNPPQADENPYAYLSNYRLLEWAPELLRPQLAEGNKRNRTIELPMPHGGTAQVNIQLDPIMAPGLAANYPEIKTYRILPSNKIRGGRLGWTHKGLHATVRTAEGTVYIDPYLVTDDRYYVSYYVHENVNPRAWSDFQCDVTGEHNVIDLEDHYPSPETLEMQDAMKTGEPLMQRKYRLAVACTSEFAQYHGGTTEDALSAVVVIVNRLNEIFEVELGLRAELVENTDQVLFLNNDTDPFTGNNPNNLTGDSHQTLVDVIGAENFDYGHTFGRNNNSGQGLAVSVMGGGAVCNPNLKGAAASSSQDPIGDTYTVDIIAHEMGHQFGGSHTMGSCHNMNTPTAYEPGSGSTILSYAGICSDTLGVIRNIEPNADPYYHVGTLQQMIPYMHEQLGDQCAEKTDLGNSKPDVSLPYTNGFYTPISTPFELKASATDMENDDLTFCWEQYDQDDELRWPPGLQQGNQPLFRSYPPTESSSRTFPRIGRVVNNQNHRTEVLPTYDRRLTFRCTVRDNFPGSGAVSWKQMHFFATTEAGPFLVMSPNAGDEAWEVGAYQEVTWDVANTDGELVNCQRVNIRLSTDGGFTYPITLIGNTPNDGSAFITVPDMVTADARIRVEAADNIFFDISNENFEIVPATAPGYSLDVGPYLQEDLCSSELVEVDVVTGSLQDYTGQVDLEVISALPDGVTASFEPAALVPGENSTLTLDFTESYFQGHLFVEVRAISADMDTSYREVELTVINNLFDQLEQLAPFDGRDDIQVGTEFMWTDIPHATTYEFEIATSPTFGETVLESIDGIEANTYIPSIILEDNSLYFWRIRAANSCGAGDWVGPSTFHTINAICQETASADTPVNIPGTGALPTRTSEINVPFAGTISDVNIPNVNVQYQPVQNFRISLISPEMTEVILYDEDICFGTDRVSIGFDDDAANEILCPPDDNIVFRPVGELSDFIGENSQGVWTMKVQILESGFGAPGSIDNWNIEFCATAVATTPALLTNETLAVPPGLENPVSSQELEITSPVAGPAQLIYTIVSLPANGTLKFLGEELGIGDHFSQASINGYNVSYEHDGTATTTDEFTFVVQDGMGGYLPIQTFNIIIDENAVVNTIEVDPADEFLLFPNPTEGEVQVQFAQPTRMGAPVRVFNVQGQLLQELILPAGSQQLDIDLSEYAAGLYLVQYGTRTDRVVKN